MAWFGWFLGELVVHSTEWTTGAALFLVFALVSDDFRGASGPLGGVDHWRGAFLGFWPGSGLFPGASGPLDGVDHWRGAFPRFRAGFALFPGASGPLGGVDHWRGAFPKFCSVFESSPKSCVKICRLSYSLFAFGEVDKEGARIGLPSIV